MPAHIAVDPKRVEMPGLEPSGESVIHWLPERNSLLASDGRQKFVFVSLEQRHVPLNRLFKGGVEEVSDGYIAGEEHFEMNVRFASDSAQQGCLVLNRVGDQVG